MKGRASKQIKLTEEEYLALNSNAAKLKQTIQSYTNAVLINYIETHIQTEEVQFLMPKKSASYRTLWIAPSVSNNLRAFAKSKDVSQNTVLYTAIKRRINLYPENISNQTVY